MRDYWKLKTKFLEMYGGVCACCGEPNPKFLTIDHVRNDGKEHRSRIEYYVIERDGKKSPQMPRIKRFGTTHFFRDALSTYQPEVYQILCYNCNFGRAQNGGVCPHKEKPQG